MTPKASIRKCLCLHGDDYSVTIFPAGSTPNYPERSYIVFYEDAYGDQHFDFVSLSDLKERFAKYNGKSFDECLTEAGITLEELHNGKV